MTEDILAAPFGYTQELPFHTVSLQKGKLAAFAVIEYADAAQKITEVRTTEGLLIAQACSNVSIADESPFWAILECVRNNEDTFEHLTPEEATAQPHRFGGEHFVKNPNRVLLGNMEYKTNSLDIAAEFVLFADGIEAFCAEPLPSQTNKTQTLYKENTAEFIQQGNRKMAALGL